MSKSPDRLDEASENEEIFRQRAINNAREALQIPKGFDGKNCWDCEEPIPQARLLSGMVYRCIFCQTKHEHRIKGY